MVPLYELHELDEWDFCLAQASGILRLGPCFTELRFQTIAMKKPNNFSLRVFDFFIYTRRLTNWASHTNWANPTNWAKFSPLCGIGPVCNVHALTSQ